VSCPSANFKEYEMEKQGQAIQDALKETGKARRPSWIEEIWVEIINNELMLMPSETKLTHVKDIFATDYEPYKKEIRPERAGELWQHKDGRFACTDLDGGELWLIDVAGNEMVQGVNYNGWKRIYSPDEEVMKELEGEKIVIEGVKWRQDAGSTIIYPGADTVFEWRDFIDKPRCTMTLTWPKE
jgi:hypothetical protein